MTRITTYNRINTTTGELQVASFSKFDGERFHEQWNDGYTQETALLIVNRWNYVTAIQPTTKIDFFFYVPSVEGAS